MKGRLLSIAGACAVVCAMGSVGLADSVTVDATFGLPTGSEYVGITSNYVAPGQYYAGAYNFTLNGIAGSSASSPLTLKQVEHAIGSTPGSVFRGVCIDFTHDISNGQPSIWTVANLTDMKATPSGPAGDGNGVGISTHQAAAIGSLWDKYQNDLGSTETGAILQMAVWEILYDSTKYPTTITPAPSPAPTLSYNGGTAAGDISSALSAAADAWNNTSDSSPTDAYALIDTEGTQSFAFLVSSDHNSENRGIAVPLPKSAGVGFAMLGGLASLGMLRRSRRAKQRIA